MSDTFLDSAWYFLRYPSTEFDDRPFDPARTRKWLPVTSYIGGNEHAVLHLLYSRFITMVLHDLGQLDFEEPFRKFRAHGLIVKDGSKMSKSRGNVVVPDEYIAQWGADTFRMYLMFLGPFQEGGDFRDEGISGPRRFLEKVWNLVGQTALATRDSRLALTPRPATRDSRLTIKYHQTVKRVTEGMEQLHYNTSIAALMEFVNALREEGSTHREMVEGLILMLAPFAPHFAEESWERLGHDTSIFDARWPEWDESAGGGGPGRGGDPGQREDPGQGVGAAGCGSGGGGGGGAGGCGGAAVYRGEGGSEGGVRAEPVAELGGRLSLSSPKSMSRAAQPWKPVSAEVFQSVRNSGQTVQIARNQYPEWANKVAEIQAIWIHDYQTPRALQSTDTSTPVSGSFDVERRGKQQGDSLKFDRYYYITSGDGSFWQSGPYKNVDYGHHLTERPDFLEQYPRSSSST